MKNLAKPKLFTFNKFVKLSKHWGIYVGFHKSFHTKSIEYQWKVRFNGSHRGLTIFIQVWDRYFELELTDNRHEGEY